MDRRICTAVAAVAEERLARRMVALLAAAGLQLECAVGDGHSAIDAIMQLRPDVLIADQMLPGMDGISLMRAVIRARPPVLPDRVLLCREGFMLPDAAGLDGVVRINVPATDSQFRAAIEELRGMPPYIDVEMMARAEALHRFLGFPDHIGTECLVLASVICLLDERYMNGSLIELEKLIAEMKHIHEKSADRAMRHAIDIAWQSDRLEEQYRVFGDTIDAGRGRPTCREMIAQIADILRLEG